jgi:multidrug resistance protein MdtO
MALRADNAITGSSVWHLITEPSPGRLAFAARLALICTLVAVFAEVYKTPEIALTVYLVFFLNKPDRTSSMLLTVAIVVIVTALVGILLLIATPLLANSGLRVLTMAVISFVMMFLGSASKLKPIASILALVIAYALDILAKVPFGEAATRGVLYLWLFFAIPALVSSVVNLLIAPSPRSLLQKEIAERLRAAATALAEQNGAAGQNSKSSVLMGDAETQKHLKLAGLEKTSSEEDVAALKGASDCVVTVLSAVQLMLDEPQAMPPQEIKEEIESKLTELVDIFEAGGYPARVEPVKVDGNCSDLAVSAVAFLNSGLIQFGEVRPAVESKKEKEKGSGLFLPDAFTNPVHVQFALKVTGAAMLCYLIYSVLSWPGIHTALITCYIVALTTAGESVEKLTLRILGCLAGAGLGFFVMLRVVPGATDIGDLAAIVFAGAFLAAWIAAGDKHISYAGFQIAFAYFLCVIQGPSPSFNMVVARDRVIGILLGNVVSYFAATRVWPVSVGPRIDSALQKARQKLESLSEVVDGWSRRRLVAETQSMVEEITSDIHLAAYEPEWIRPDRTRLATQQHAAEAIERLETPMLGVAELTPEQASDRLSESQDLRATVETPAASNQSRQSKSLAALETVLRRRLAALQQAVWNLKQAEPDG